jgi:sarcosine oxidase subunit beta
MNRRWANAMRMNGVDSELLSRDDIHKEVPILDLDCRFPVHGGFTQRRAGISRHDAVVWAYARAADAAGVDIIESCEVSGFEQDGGHITAVLTSRGHIAADRLRCASPGTAANWPSAQASACRLKSVALQAMVTEPVKPICTRWWHRQ